MARIGIACTGFRRNLDFLVSGRIVPITFTPTSMMYFYITAIQQNTISRSTPARSNIIRFLITIGNHIIIHTAGNIQYQHHIQRLRLGRSGRRGRGQRRQSYQEAGVIALSNRDGLVLTAGKGYIPRLDRLIGPDAARIHAVFANGVFPLSQRRVVRNGVRGHSCPAGFINRIGLRGQNAHEHDQRDDPRPQTLVCAHTDSFLSDSAIRTTGRCNPPPHIGGRQKAFRYALMYSALANISY